MKKSSPTTTGVYMDQNDLMRIFTQALEQMNGVPSVKRGTRSHRYAPRGKLTDEQKAEFMAKNDVECVRVFTEAGFKDVRPRENVLTFRKWDAKGRVPKGSHGYKVGPFTLFHIDQTVPKEDRSEPKSDELSKAIEDTVQQITETAPTDTKKLNWTDWNK
jgi:hypothetical protein